MWLELLQDAIDWHEDHPWKMVVWNDLLTRYPEQAEVLASRAGDDLPPYLKLAISAAQLRSEASLEPTDEQGDAITPEESGVSGVSQDPPPPAPPFIQPRPI